MTALDDARRAFDDEDYDESLQICDDALSTTALKRDVPLLCHRSKTFLAVGLAQEAFADAVDAAAIAADDCEALLRLGIAAHEIGAHEKAREVLERGITLETAGTSRRAMMMKWLGRAREAESEAKSGKGALSSSAVEKFRRAWFQSQTHVTVEIYAKGVTADALTVDFNDACDEIRVTIDALSGGDGHAKMYDPYVLDLRLFGAVFRDAGAVNVTPVKVEIRMMKRTPVHWDDLERRGGGGLATSTVAGTKNVYNEVIVQKDKRSAKDWDALEAELDAELADEKPQGDEALNELFQKIYMNADDDTRRAMNKSFQESGGTVLSTDWKDVGSKTVAPEAP